MNQEEKRAPGGGTEAPGMATVSPALDPEKTTSSGENVGTLMIESVSSLTLYGTQLWILLGVLYLSVYLLALELTMLSTVVPTLTNEFGAVADISWYESAYVLPL